jgi:ribose transport system substrate-binding protein
MKAKYLLACALLGLTSLVVLTACGSSAGTKEAQESTGSEAEEVLTGRSWNQGGKITIPDPGPGSAKGMKIAFSGFGQDNPYSQWIFKAIEKEAEKLGGSATFVGPPSYEPQGQYETLSDIAQAKNYDAVILLPIDGAQIVPAVEALIKAEIPVASVDHVIGANQNATAVQVPGVTTEVIAPVAVNAETMGEGVITACKGVEKCEVDVLWGTRSLAFDHAKIAPFKATIAGHSNIDVVCEADANYTQDDGRTDTADCLSANPGLDVVAAQADESARGAESSIEAAGRSYGMGKEDVKIIGSYASRYGVKQVRDGKWVQTWYARPESMGFTTTDLLVEALHGNKVQSWITQEELDGAGSKLDKKTLEENPEIKGQWEG